MSLHHYEVDMSQLSSDEKTVLTQRINRLAETDLAWNSVTQSGTFFIDEKTNLTKLQIPSECRLTRIP